ncbi:MAG TPA: hypothetical protein VHU84_06155 [Lacipirellulaceae bacterium]|nr:hypothetical protein [Lacipirellulaceae bacterium]
MLEEICQEAGGPEGATNQLFAEVGFMQSLKIDRRHGHNRNTDAAELFATTT